MQVSYHENDGYEAAIIYQRLPIIQWYRGFALICTIALYSFAIVFMATIDTPKSPILIYELFTGAIFMFLLPFMNAGYWARFEPIVSEKIIIGILLLILTFGSVLGILTDTCLMPCTGKIGEGIVFAWLNTMIVAAYARCIHLLNRVATSPV